jgi:hypothetical protein
MGSRERRRAERQKRKRRGGERTPPVEEDVEDGAQNAAPQDGSGKAHSPADLAARAEARDQAARDALEPLAEGERPTVVTVGAVISTLVAAIFWVSAVVALVADVEVNGAEQRPLPIALFAAVVTAMAYGMWRARYWAVLGFQAFLVLIMLSAALGLVSVTTVLQAAGTTLLLALSGTLFYFMVKALARIQMPQRRPPD